MLFSHLKQEKAQNSNTSAPPPAPPKHPKPTRRSTKPAPLWHQTYTIKKIIWALPPLVETGPGLYAHTTPALGAGPVSAAIPNAGCGVYNSM
ncbi:hypothetical protein ACFGVS_23470 [Mucilaginibacter sp. AW1-7]|uniref:hypothetical protein n=1 Tax=Mucilaginibacter sp. AW1-7 TaxID=3349874 RepID=UPI003F735C03